jgi:uncharacterized damage-inducible protein DinB
MQFRHLALLVALAALPLESARSQDVMDVKSAAYLRDRYLADMDTVHNKLLQLANAIPADKYSWRPAAGVRSVSEVLMHVVSEWLFYGPRSVGGKEPADFGVPKEALPKLEKDYTAKAQVIEQLTKSWTYFVAQVKAADAGKLTGIYPPWKVSLADAAFGMTGDQHEHLGQMIAYARSIGVKPPWSQ